MKKILRYCLVFILFITLLVGCGQSNNEKKYTITKEEWNALVGQCNYTVESKDNEGSIFYNYIQKYTEQAIDLNGTIVIFLEDKQYTLSEEETGWIATDCTSLNFEKGCLLVNYNFEDFTYDESKNVYVSEIQDQNYWNEILFENGVLIKITTFIMKEDLNLENCHKIEKVFTNIGTTVIDIPEYTFAFEDSVTTVTEETWNKYMNEYNFSIKPFLLDSNEMEKNVQLSIEGAYYLRGKYYVLKDDKIYLLSETDNGWIGEEIDSFPGYHGSLLRGISFSEVEFNQTDEAYVTKNIDENGMRYHFYFEKGIPVIIYVENTLSPDLSEYYLVEQIGEITFELPEYVIK